MYFHLNLSNFILAKIEQMWRLLNLRLSVLYRESSLNHGFVFIGHFQQV